MFVALLSFSLGVLLGYAQVPWLARLIAPAMPLTYWAVMLLQASDQPATGGDDNSSLVAAVAVVSVFVALFGVAAGLLLKELTSPGREFDDE